MSQAQLTGSERILRVVDGVAIAWVLVWIGLGTAIGINVAHLSRLSQAVAGDGAAVQSLGGALAGLADAPVIGGVMATVARHVQDAGAVTVASGQSSADSIRFVGVLLAVAVGLLPSLPVVGLYLPLRLARRREVRAVRTALARHGGDAAFQSLLAQRALVNLGYRELCAEAELWRNEQRRPELLAAAELRRLGIDPDLR